MLIPVIHKSIPDDSSINGFRFTQVSFFKQATTLVDLYICFQVFYDKAIRTRLGNHNAVKSYYDSAHVHLQASYCHSSLGSKIKIDRVRDLSLFEHPKNLQLSASGQGLLDVSDFTLNNMGNADLIIYLTDNDDNGGTGIAPIGTLCEPSEQTWNMNLGGDIGIVPKKVNAWKSSINEYQTSAASFGTVSFKRNI